MGNHSFQPWQLSFDRRSSLLSPSNYLHKTVTNTTREMPSSQIATLFTLEQIEVKGLAPSPHKDMSLTSFPFCTARRAQNPNQPRLLSTSYNSWHNMSRASWQLKATSATLQVMYEEGKCVVGSCSPMMNNAPLPRLFSSESLSPTTRKSPQSSCADRSRHMLSLFSTGPKPDQLPEDQSAPSSKGKRRARHTARSSLGSSLRGGRTETHTVPCIQKRPKATTAETDLTPHSCLSLLPCFDKASSQLCLGTDFLHSVKLCPAQQVGP